MVAKKKTSGHYAKNLAAGIVARWVGVKVADVVRRWGKTVDVAALVREAWTAKQPQIATTYAELATALGMTCADPERTLKSYVARGMPGQVGVRGKQAARFDVRVCREWIDAHVKHGATGGGGNKRERLLELDIEIKEREKLAQLERLADVEEVAAFAETCVANARAILEAIPDQVLAGLEGIAEGRRKTIHSTVTELVDTAFEELARLSEGDTDPTEDEETQAGNTPAA